MAITTRLAQPADADAIAAIYNQGIEDRGATFETSPRTAAEIVPKIELGDRFPLVVAEDGDAIVGWAGLSEYRPRVCYAGIAEFSIYVDRAWRGRGIGRTLLTALIQAAAERGFWKLVSRVFTFNKASLALCRSCGFREVGTYEKHARLDGAWLDVVIVEHLIDENLAKAP